MKQRTSQIEDDFSILEISVKPHSEPMDRDLNSSKTYHSE